MAPAVSTSEKFQLGITGNANNSAVELRRKAIRVAIAMTSGAYKTSLVSYFTHRDLFPSLMKVRHTRS